MNITRDVIIDLWPAYQAGEVSAETRALVDEFLASDPDFASVLKKFGDARRLLQEPRPAEDDRSERRTVEQVRGRVVAQWLMLGAAVLTTGLVLLAVVGTAFMMLTSRRLAIGVPELVFALLPLSFLMAVSAACWWGFSRMARG